VENSLDVANAYLEEHGQIIRTDIVNMEGLDDAAPWSLATTTSCASWSSPRQACAGCRWHSWSMPWQAVIAAIEREAALQHVPADIIKLARRAVPLSTPSENYRVNAIVKLQKYPGRYLYASRAVSPKVIGHLRRTTDTYKEYEETRKRRGELKFAHGLIYSTLSLTALLAAIWAGLWFAGRFVAPIRRIIGAAQQVSRGNLQVTLPERRGEGDLSRLSSTFNKMTSEIKSQRDALVTANEQLTERRVFMEAVLSGVSAGVLGLDADGRITIANRSSEQLLGREVDSLVGHRLDEVLPEFDTLLKAAAEPHLRNRAQHEVTLDVKGDERTFAVRLTREQDEATGARGNQGAVVTFDDITELVSAQRTSAWADVARRIAHEIKNPLTPIILSAERIRRKYGRVITEDRETFDKLTATIERQAGDIKTMVDEFAAFARVRSR
jgi:two-component system nitrogen regulation sensor histidine kinase NtrY